VEHAALVHLLNDGQDARQILAHGQPAIDPARGYPIASVRQQLGYRQIACGGPTQRARLTCGPARGNQQNLQYDIVHAHHMTHRVVFEDADSLRHLAARQHARQDFKLGRLHVRTFA